MHNASYLDSAGYIKVYIRSQWLKLDPGFYLQAKFAYTGPKGLNKKNIN